MTDYYEKLDAKLYVADYNYDLGVASENRRAYSDATSYFQKAKNAYEDVRVCAIAIKDNDTFEHAKTRIRSCNVKVAENSNNYNAVKSDNPGLKHKNEYKVYTK